MVCMREPHVDRFGRDVTRMSPGELFMAQARGGFEGQRNPDSTAWQKEQQRRALKAQFAVTNWQYLIDSIRTANMPQPTLAPAPMMLDGQAMMSSFPGHQPHRPIPQMRHTSQNAGFPHHARSASQPFPSTSGAPSSDVDS